MLPGVKVVKDDEEAMASFLPTVLSRLANAGDVSAMVGMADADVERGAVEAAISWMCQAVSASETSDGTGDGSLGGIARYQLLEKLANLQLQVQPWLGRAMYIKRGVGRGYGTSELVSGEAMVYPTRAWTRLRCIQIGLGRAVVHPLCPYKEEVVHRASSCHAGERVIWCRRLF